MASTSASFQNIFEYKRNHNVFMFFSVFAYVSFNFFDTIVTSAASVTSLDAIAIIFVASIITTALKKRNKNDIIRNGELEFSETPESKRPAPVNTFYRYRSNKDHVDSKNCLLRKTPVNFQHGGCSSARSIRIADNYTMIKFTLK